jgi:hypothetical protein
LVEIDEAIRIAVREGAQEDSVDEAEDGGGGADAEGERYDGEGGESGVLAEHAEAEGEILHERWEEVGGAGGAAGFHGLGERAEFELGAATGFGGRDAGRD